MLSFPVLLEHELACGVDGHGASVRASVLDGHSGVGQSRRRHLITRQIPKRSLKYQLVETMHR